MVSEDMWHKADPSAFDMARYDNREFLVCSGGNLTAPHSARRRETFTRRPPMVALTPTH